MKRHIDQKQEKKLSLPRRIYNALAAVLCAPDVRDRYYIMERDPPETEPPTKREHSK